MSSVESVGSDSPPFRARRNTWPCRQPHQQTDGHKNYSTEDHVTYSPTSGSHQLPLVNEEEVGLDDVEYDVGSVLNAPHIPNTCGKQQVGSRVDLAVSNASRTGSYVHSGSRRNPWGNISYADLITLAITSAPEQRLTLSEIYAWIIENVPYFRDKSDSASSVGWKNSIRHNLSLHSRFVRSQNEGTGKSSWWMINTKKETTTTNKQLLKEAAVHPRRRANTLDSTSKMIVDKRRGAKWPKRRILEHPRMTNLRRVASSGSLLMQAVNANVVDDNVVVANISNHVRKSGSPDFGISMRPRASSTSSAMFRPRVASNSSSGGGAGRNSDTPEGQLHLFTAFDEVTGAVVSSGDDSLKLFDWMPDTIYQPATVVDTEQSLLNFEEKLNLKDGDDDKLWPNIEQQQQQQQQKEAKNDLALLEDIKPVDFNLDFESSRLLMQTFLEETQKTSESKETDYTMIDDASILLPRINDCTKEEEDVKVDTNEIEPKNSGGHYFGGHKIKILEPREMRSVQFQDGSIPSNHQWTHSDHSQLPQDPIFQLPSTTHGSSGKILLDTTARRYDPFNPKSIPQLINPIHHINYPHKDQSCQQPTPYSGQISGATFFDVRPPPQESIEGKDLAQISTTHQHHWPQQKPISAVNFSTEHHQPPNDGGVLVEEDDKFYPFCGGGGGGFRQTRTGGRIFLKP